eukprot:TRINITY_DN707_c0_g1_i1.p3 TRINITY_DN707_c0_g1~~TRINITY_DN707_c0_g1_i1.p3  ORF type:complete len:289 (-),score=50.78 TRINITY_DN707_c0_g1_i1:1446-2312(-)
MASSSCSGQQAQEEESLAIEPSRQNATPLFRARKRSRKARKKRLQKEKDDKLDDDERVSKTDLLLIKEAQAMREKTRIAALDTKLTGRKSKLSSEKVDTETGKEHESTAGLRNDFAVERSNNLMEEHMNKYIEEGVRRRFGDPESLGTTTKGSVLEEDSMYAIPEHLRVEARQQYDPGEGMPAAGVEEVELPEDVRRKNEIETLRAREELYDVVSSGVRSNGASSAYLKSEQRSSPKCTSDQNNKLNEQSHEQASYAPAAKNVDGKKRRFGHATDNLVADRFRKRWRR